MKRTSVKKYFYNFSIHLNPDEMTMPDAILVLAALLSGLIAGLFYGYSCSVNIGLGKLTDIEYLRAMQSINRSILNPVFFSSFMGTILLTGIAAWMQFSYGRMYSFYFLLSGLAVYLVAVFGVTAFRNVPLNQTLAAFRFDNASETQIHEVREKFEGPWNRYHAVRTVASVVSFMLIILSLVYS
jgi:uncharacterized membrane protein